MNTYVLLKGALVSWLFLAFICYVFTHFLTFLMLSLPIYICSPWIIYNFQLKNLLQIAHFLTISVAMPEQKPLCWKNDSCLRTYFRWRFSYEFVCFFFVCLFVWVEFCYFVRVFFSNLKTESSLATCVELQG